MNSRPDNRTRLLAETLHGDWAAGPAAAMAQRAATYARRRRTAKAAIASLAGAAVVAAYLFLSGRERVEGTRVPASPAPIAAKPPAAPVGYEIISDDELVATLSDRPLLVLPQENGGKKIVLLDR